MFFELIEKTAVAFFAVATVFIFLWIKGVIPSSLVVIHAFQIILVSPPVIWVAILIRWKYKWPKPISWFTLAFGAATATSFLFSVRMLLLVYREENPPILMDVVLPTMIAALAGICIILGIRWFYDRSSQQSAWERPSQ